MGGFKSKVEYVLKHNVVISKIFRFCASTFIKFIGLFVPVDEKAVLFTALSKKYNDSSKAIYEYMLKNPKYSNFKFYWAVTETEKDKIPGNPIIVKPDSFKYFITALKCKYWVANVNIERSLKFKRKKTVYLHTWHGIPIKTVGNEVAGRKDYDFSYVDYFCVSSDYEVDLYKRSFNVSENQILKVGMPRNDVLYNTTNEEIDAIKEKLNLPKDKKIILYAPTWRDSKDGGSSYQIKPPINISLWEEKLGSDYVLLFRTHHYTNKLVGVEFNDFVLDYTSYPNVNDLLKIADVLVSDYSGTIFDYSIVERPVICFAYDYDDYVIERGFAMDYLAEFNSHIVKTENEVIDKILTLNYQEEVEKTKLIKSKYVTYGGSAIESCVEALFTNAKLD